jgi:class 3 adenylate cyclase
MVPQTRYARTPDGLDIAYQVFGEGPLNLVIVHAYISHMEIYWEWPGFERAMQRLGMFATVAHFDKRGTGLSDRFTQIPDLEARMDDVRAVMDAAGMEKAALLGWGDGASLACLFAATYPERILALALYAAAIRTAWAPDFPWGWTREDNDVYMDQAEEIWGREDRVRELIALAVDPAPSSLEDAAFGRWVARISRYATTPTGSRSFNQMWFDTDARPVLPTIQVPTAFIYRHADDDEESGQEQAHYAAMVPGAQLVELHDEHWFPWVGNVDALVKAVGSFLEDVQQEEAQLDRVLATILFTDIVDSTAQSASMGDQEWRRVREEHDRLIRAFLTRYRGREIKTMGDGFLATFDGPARAVRCAHAITAGVQALGIEVRAGVHTGEVDLEGADIAGISVSIGARVGALAGPSQVLVSQTVKDLVAGSGLAFEVSGEYELKGVPDRWRLYELA